MGEVAVNVGHVSGLLTLLSAALFASPPFVNLSALSSIFVISAFLFPCSLSLSSTAACRQGLRGLAS